MTGLLSMNGINEKGAKVYGLTLEGKIAYRSLLQLSALPCRRPNTSRHVHGVDDETVPMEKKCSVPE